MNVMFVTKDFHDQAVYWHTKELTHETNLMKAMFVTISFPHQVIYRDTKETHDGD